MIFEKKRISRSALTTVHQEHLLHYPILTNQTLSATKTAKNLTAFVHLHEVKNKFAGIVGNPCKNTYLSSCHS